MAEGVGRKCGERTNELNDSPERLEPLPERTTQTHAKRAGIRQAAIGAGRESFTFGNRGDADEGQANG